MSETITRSFRYAAVPQGPLSGATGKGVMASFQPAGTRRPAVGQSCFPSASMRRTVEMMSGDWASIVSHRMSSTSASRAPPAIISRALVSAEMRDSAGLWPLGSFWGGAPNPSASSDAPRLSSLVSPSSECFAGPPALLAVASDSRRFEELILSPTGTGDPVIEWPSNDTPRDQNSEAPFPESRLQGWPAWHPEAAKDSGRLPFLR